MKMRTRRTRTTEAITSTTRAKTTDVSKTYDPNLEVHGYSEKGTRGGKTPTVIDGNCEDEDDIFSSRTRPTSPRVTGNIRYGLTTPPWRRHCSGIAANGLSFAIAERLPPRCNLLPPRFWKLEYGALATSPTLSFSIHLLTASPSPSSKCFRIP